MERNPLMRFDSIGANPNPNAWLNTSGHRAVLHGCTVEDEAFVGMGATLSDGMVVEKQGMLAAGAPLRQNTRVPSGEF
ncbi:Gamma carbonic anhydrase 1 [Nymphaea thermarum]|nr:Gamma carbonic anhydrase 1 [Nymphaea thermarum]